MFSVILPVYNGARFICDAIYSVFAQREKDWELIIVNDGSTDGTDTILEKYKKHPRVRYIKQDNLGVSVARNRGVAASKGSHIAFLDADDFWHENHLAVMRELIEQYPHAGLYGSFTRTELVNGRTSSRCHFFENHDETVYLEDFFAEYARDKSVKMFTVITTCITREAFEKAGGFPEGCKIGEDLELSLRIAAYFPVVLTSRSTATYRKKNSEATKHNSFDPDWGFFDGVKELYADDTIPASKKDHIKAVMEWFTLRRCRHYLIAGEKEKARRYLSETGYMPGLEKDRFLTILLLHMPTPLVQKLFEFRWRGKS